MAGFGEPVGWCFWVKVMTELSNTLVEGLRYKESAQKSGTIITYPNPPSFLIMFYKCLHFKGVVLKLTKTVVHIDWRKYEFSLPRTSISRSNKEVNLPPYRVREYQ